jgi:GT2 family glycosyltransferase
MNRMVVTSNGSEKQIAMTPVDIIVPVCDGAATIRDCLDKLLMERGNSRIILVNDGTDPLTSSWLGELARGNQHVLLLEHGVALGYTRAVNTALPHAVASHVALLDSRVTVSAGWLARLQRCLESADELGMVAPLCNVAEFGAGQALDLSTAEAVTADHVAEVVAGFSQKSYPRVSILSAPCVLIKRSVLDELGALDAATFPRGHGETIDYGLRASAAGFELAIADDVYVHFTESQGGQSHQEFLQKAGMDALRRKHGAAVTNALFAPQEIAALAPVRTAVSAAFRAPRNRALVPVTLQRSLNALASEGYVRVIGAWHNPELRRHVETIRRKARKLKRDPERFFEDSRSPVLRTVAKLLRRKTVQSR